MNSEQAEQLTDAVDRAANSIGCCLGMCFESDRTTDGKIGGNVVDGLDHVADAIRFHARSVMALAEAVKSTGGRGA